MEKCIGCHFYDRHHNNQTDSRGIQWGQCRRSAPMLHPINQKSFMIEGVWPHVRDDDWCGEWKGAGVARRGEQRSASDSKTPGPLLPIAGGASLGARPVPATPLHGAGSHGSVSSLHSLISSGRGD
ncbi:MAG: hypothetical protein IT518_15800 [Burkholderiales bacterium]|nr:hypothetical protein [Burkholderiales bacterium]